MSNMSYCRFTNTRTDLNDCLDSLRHDERMSEMEVREGRKIVRGVSDFLPGVRHH